MVAETLVLLPADLTHFADRGYVRVGSAFTSDQAAAMRDVVWEALAGDGVLRDDPSTWTVEAPSHLQHLKRHPALRSSSCSPHPANGMSLPDRGMSTTTTSIRWFRSAS